MNEYSDLFDGLLNYNSNIKHNEEVLNISIGGEKLLTNITNMTNMYSK